ncbi:hypothetical protein BHM03_00044203 [Ensete ventricosum]|nr:hypothetical protein BHM03_00044203 [Ensete ventricosum]
MRSVYSSSASVYSIGPSDVSESPNPPPPPPPTRPPARGTDTPPPPRPVLHSHISLPPSLLGQHHQIRCRTRNTVSYSIAIISRRAFTIWRTRRRNGFHPIKNRHQGTSESDRTVSMRRRDCLRFGSSLRLTSQDAESMSRHDVSKHADRRPKVNEPKVSARQQRRDVKGDGPFADEYGLTEPQNRSPFPSSCVTARTRWTCGPPPACAIYIIHGLVPSLPKNRVSFHDGEADVLNKMPRLQPQVKRMC